MAIYSNSLEQIASLEKENNLQVQDILRTQKSNDILKELSSLKPVQIKNIMNIIIEVGKISNIKNPMILSHKEKLELVEKIKGMVRELEKVVGISNITQVPTDVDQELVERCS